MGQGAACAGFLGLDRLGFVALACVGAARFAGHADIWGGPGVGAVGRGLAFCRVGGFGGRCGGGGVGLGVCCLVAAECVMLCGGGDGPWVFVLGYTGFY